MECNYKQIPLKDIEQNRGQIPGVPKNPRQWTKEELERLKKSIIETPELLDARGLLVFPYKKKYIVLGGNMRYSALKELGVEEAPCIICPADLSTDKLREIIIKDNGSFGQWDFDELANNFDIEDLTEWGVNLPDYSTEESEELPDKEAEDDAYDVEEALEKIEEPTTKRGDIWQLGEHRLMCGDSTSAEEVSALMDGELADLSVTDPPYNVAIEGGTKDKLTIMNDNMSSGAFSTFLYEAFCRMYESLKPGAANYVFFGASELLAFVSNYIAAGFLYKQLLIWVKNTITLSRQDYQHQHEPCLYGWKDGAGHYFVDDRTKRTIIEEQVDFDNMSKNELRDFLKHAFSTEGVITDIVRENKPLRNAEHPTMKPIPLIGRFIHNSSKRGHIVVDLFGGSGTTLIACEQMSRHCRTMELDPRYCDVIIDRWQKNTGRKAKLIKEGSNETRTTTNQEEEGRD